MRKAQAGMTLMEVLIAVTLVSFLSIGMLWAIRVGINAMGRANDRIMSNRRVTGSRRVLEQEIHGLMPIAAQLGDRRRIMFFQGEPQTMRFVSSYSLQEGSRGMPQVLEFQVIEGDPSVGGVRLIVNETPYSGPRSAGALILGIDVVPGVGPVPRFGPVEASTRSFVIADRLASCSFSYKRPRPRPQLESWESSWVLATFPLAVRIDMQPLDNSPGALHMTSIALPLQVNRVATESYDDN